MTNAEKFALFLVTYPKCNEGAACRQVWMAFPTFEDLWEYCEEHEASTIGHCGWDDELAPPAWDYFEMAA